MGEACTALSVLAGPKRGVGYLDDDTVFPRWSLDPLARAQTGLVHPLVFHLRGCRGNGQTSTVIEHGLVPGKIRQQTATKAKSVIHIDFEPWYPKVLTENQGQRMAFLLAVRSHDQGIFESSLPPCHLVMLKHRMASLS